MKDSEKIICGSLTVALMAYCVAHQVDPVVAVATLTKSAVDTAVQGIQFGWNIVKIAAKSTAIIGGGYLAVKSAIELAKVSENKLQQLQAHVAARAMGVFGDDRDYQEEELSESEELESEYSYENDAAESDDDFEESSENHQSEDEHFTTEPEDALNDEEIRGLLADQKRVVFLHGAIKLSTLTAVKSVMKGPYRLRPRA
ncbi:MAG: hypothetical protein AB7I18_02485 [Candidatus Berkiella sp.]